MKQLFDKLEKNERCDYLIDTCFFIHSFVHDHDRKLMDLCRNKQVGMTSFNIEEFLHMHHKLKGHTNHRIRSFLKSKVMVNATVDVSPGDRAGEKRYVEMIDPGILKVIEDPSDAVLFAYAYSIDADILTKDKHHIFTAGAENFSKVRVLKEFP